MAVGKSQYLKGHTSWIRSPETSDPCQPSSKSGMSIVAHPQKIEMGIRHKAGMGSQHPHQHPLSLSVTSCRSRIQHRNSIVASFRAAECKIQIGIGSSHAWEGGGPNKNTRIPIRSQDLRENPRFSHGLRVQSRSREPPGSNYGLRTYRKIYGSSYSLRAPVMIPGSKGEPSGSPTTSGSQTQSQDPKENLRVPQRPPGPRYNLRI
ncbi:hypothetical protein DY000_02021515 [Brassica cretica]|uniref:DUF4005 domain-containing protein n=1 Tax=Brassica cretica TaxID=69181 RepID=A0ABQ7E536_BRACR|nr:hypothetical protein DY000_02021515 [Brassica cretica]